MSVNLLFNSCIPELLPFPGLRSGIIGDSSLLAAFFSPACGTNRRILRTIGAAVTIPTSECIGIRSNSYNKPKKQHTTFRPSGRGGSSSVVGRHWRILTSASCPSSAQLSSRASPLWLLSLIGSSWNILLLYGTLMGLGCWPGELVSCRTEKIKRAD